MLAPKNLAIDARLTWTFNLLSYKNNDLPNTEPKQHIFDKIEKLIWYNWPNYFGPYCGSTVTIQSVTMEFVDVLVEDVEKIKKRFPNLKKFEAYLSNDNIAPVPKFNSVSF